MKPGPAFTLVAALVATIVLGWVTATPKPAGAAGATKVSGPDREFMTKAAQGGMAEVKLGQLAAKNGSGAAKSFGQHMVADHGKANGELKSLAAKKGVTLPKDVAPEHKATMARLSKLSGATFNKAYLEDMVEDHEKDVAEFRKEAKTGKDADVKGWAAKTLPTLQHHLQMARDASKKAEGDATHAGKH